MADIHYIRSLNAVPQEIASDDLDRNIFVFNVEVVFVGVFSGDGLCRFLVAKLEEASHVTFGTDVFIGRKGVLPSSSGPITSCWLYSSSKGELNSSNEIRRARVQFSVRASSYVTGEQHAVTLLNELDGLSNLTS